MSSDRARESFDPTRGYRGVVAQQGRVTLEADINEGQRIAAEAGTASNIDTVGPSGSPDDGYKIELIQGAPADFRILDGTMHVGGLRTTIPSNGTQSWTYQSQTEWLDRHADPLWRDDLGPVDQEGLLVYLLLREHEVSAVEDQTLKDVALGGPDSAQRLRLVQRVTVLPVAAIPVLDEALKSWSAQGVEFDPATMRLRSSATLRVHHVPPAQQGGNCEPVAQGGYIGADNQMIRVQLTGINDDGTINLVWGYNNASFLHRVTRAGTDTLKLAAAPVDEYHSPRAGRPVEVLRRAAELAPDDDNFIAAHTGVIATPASAFIPETLTLGFADEALGALEGEDGLLFLRLWEGVATFKSGDLVELEGTGLKVEIQVPKAGHFLSGQYWTFAVRPDTPVDVYPARYAREGQPPEGPRMWACPLATADRDGGVKDVRERFDNLVELTKRKSGGGCSILIGPEDVDNGARLAEFIKRTIGANRRASICLRPGIYGLPEPLIFDKAYAGLHLEGCRDGVQLVALEGSAERFKDGLVQIYGADEIMLRRLEIILPPPVERTKGISIGLSAVQCDALTVESCQFVHVPSSESIPISSVGMRISSTSNYLKLADCRFWFAGEFDHTKSRAIGLLAGVDMYPEDSDNGRNGVGEAASIDRAGITGNAFEGLTEAIFMRCDIGNVRCENNIVRGCDAGFLFYSTENLRLMDAVAEAGGVRATTLDIATFTTVWQAAQPALMAAVQNIAMLARLPKDIEARSPVLLAPPPPPPPPRGARRGAAVETLSMNANLSAALSLDPNGQPLPLDRIEEIFPRRRFEPVLPNLEELQRLLGESRFGRRDGFKARAPMLRVSGNDIATLESQGDPSAEFHKPGNLVVGFDSFDAVVMITANVITGWRYGYITSIVGMGTAVITGNAFLNPFVHPDAGTGFSVLFQPSDKCLASLSGNVFKGILKLVPDTYSAGSAAVNANRHPDWLAINSADSFDPTGLG